ncbi:hypothetical protein DPEC_G00327490 [Dallia pectoralis]|uniref:Uncharacterized protein n=1 Tax=Dallia pectoralis TaxID=75939 RepID=A0ACC2F845_DALPE|nr:hypothetical protein DPEC_G00327490 [Dallia pectoralis]
MGKQFAVTVKRKTSNHAAEGGTLSAYGSHVPGELGHSTTLHGQRCVFLMVLDGPVRFAMNWNGPEQESSEAESLPSCHEPLIRTAASIQR